VTTAAFRQMALALPEAVEPADIGHHDFRVEGTIFATLGYPTKVEASKPAPGKKGKGGRAQ